MRKVLLSWCLMATTGAGCIGSIEEPGGLSHRPEGIVGGDSYSGLPAVGALTVDGQMYCTGTVIAPRKVVTAAHCVVGVSASRMKFVIGSDITHPDARIQVSQMIAHPDYDSQSIRNDIALVMLVQDAPVTPMGVLDGMDANWVGASLFFVGYGVNNGYQQTGAGLKRAVWIPISEVYPAAFRYDHDQVNTCNGDSGGPAFHLTQGGDYLLAGVTSYGDAYCTSYGVDTRVDAFRDFLGLDSGGDQNPCGQETYEGRCDGSTVIWCQDSQVYQQDCAETGMGCDYDPARDYYGCIRSDDPCQGETFDGRCEGNLVIWCENEEVKSIDCSTSQAHCGYNSSKGFYDCI